MGCQSEVFIGDYLPFSICTHDVETGDVTDADSLPTYRIYENATQTAILNGTMAKLDDANTTGCYIAVVLASAANGFEDGKGYSIYIQAQVDGVIGAITLGFRAVQGFLHKDGNKTFSAATDSLEAISNALANPGVTTVTVLDGNKISVVPYTTWEFTLTGLTDLSGALANGVFFTVKELQSSADTAAILQVQEGVGLLRWNGAAAADASKATLTVGVGETSITVHVNASVTAITGPNTYVWDVKIVSTEGEDADQIATGQFYLTNEAVTRKLTTS